MTLASTRDQGRSFPGAWMRVLRHIPSPSCQASLLNAGCTSAASGCGADRLLIAAPFGQQGPDRDARQNMTLSHGTVGARARSLRVEGSAR